MQGAPKFSKIEIHFNHEIDNPDPTTIGSRVKQVSFEDAGLMITGDYIILVLDHKHEVENSTSSTGHIYPLSNVKSYTTHKV